MEKKMTIAVGIPAYNEEANIGNLLNSIFSQKIESGFIETVFIISDASTDNTVNIAKSFSDNRVKIIENEKRMGVYNCQNRIVKNANSDVLVILNGDVIPASNDFIEKIIGPIAKNYNIGLVGANPMVARPRTFFEKIMNISYKFKFDVFGNINSGNNIYNCVGIARAFSKNLYKQINWPENLPEDAYSYFLCLEKGFKFLFEPGAKVVFRTPSTLEDYVKQSTRFFAGVEKMESIFKKDLVKNEYKIPVQVYLNSTIKFMFLHPILMTGYIFLVIYAEYFLRQDYSSRWGIATSTKQVIKETDFK